MTWVLAVSPSLWASVSDACRHCNKRCRQLQILSVDLVRIMFLSVLAVVAYHWGARKPAQKRVPRSSSIPCVIQSHIPNPSSAELAVIIPCLARTNKQVEQLKRCCNSVLPQLSSKEVLLLVDDGSPMSMRKQIQDFASLHPKITLLQQTNQGPAAARNAGLQCARDLGVNLACFVDADVIATSDWLATMREMQTRRPGIYGGITQSWNATSIVGRFHDIMGTLNGRLAASPNETLLYTPTCNMSVAMALEPKFDESFPGAAFEDVEFCIRARKSEPAQYVRWAPCAVVYHDYDCSLIGFLKEFARYGSSQPLMLERHSEYNDWYIASREIGCFPQQVKQCFIDRPHAFSTSRRPKLNKIMVIGLASFAWIMHGFKLTLADFGCSRLSTGLSRAPHTSCEQFRRAHNRNVQTLRAIIVKPAVAHLVCGARTCTYN